MKFWDASAIVPLIVAEESTRRLQALAAKDSAMSYAYPQQWADVLAGQQLVTQQYNNMDGGLYFTRRF